MEVNPNYRCLRYLLPLLPSPSPPSLQRTYAPKVKDLGLLKNTEKEAHKMLSYACEHGINTLDTAEMYPIPMKEETQGLTDIYIGNWLQSQPRDQVSRDHVQVEGTMVFTISNRYYKHATCETGMAQSIPVGALASALPVELLVI
ncbi:hypothetical protein L2E82_44868 [Cichorium intybus]|uniref:Uncharacterized protein n=1 Tax=Cichorium intybus TaxID=13427 RepID=A0ACB8ZR06_CICIN|nr:hypothetical protein L2E82_44868 [Cichorium intybus]